jgi:tRNA threonylcarbamoyladenosine biosynthesis protein TsaE
MSHRQDCHIITQTADQTQALGKLIGSRLQSGAVIRLIGTLGSGKTCFVQGLARGLAVPREYDITSPTYALVHEYSGRLPLAHVDLYRIADEMDAEAAGLLDLMDSRTVVAVEWADRLDDGFWPRDSLYVHFSTRDDDGRCIQLFGYGLQMGNLINEVLALWNDKPYSGLNSGT